MKFIYDYARLPKDQKLLMDIDSAASRLFDKLSDLDVRALQISDYNKRYFGTYLTNLTSSLQLYTYILALSLAKSDVPLNRFVFLDYGGGSGMLSLLAKELNIGTVIYNDIYDVSCRDARIIGESIGNQADYYVEGDIDHVIGFLRKNGIDCNAVASYDVIEHIYDIKSFFRKIPLLSNGSLNVVMSSGANIFNPMIRKRLMKQQLEIEYKDRKKEQGHKERDCFESYLSARRQIILKYLQEVNKEVTERELEQLAKNTRGMMHIDIEKSVSNYLKTGKLPELLNHPTNTCDPYTGNWAEHLMDIAYLTNILSESGFKVWILSGYYGRSKNIAKRVVAGMLNITISIFKKHAIRIAPFFTIYGKR